MKLSPVIAALAGLALAGAQNAFTQSKTEIQQMDRNRDGVVTRAEWQGPAYIPAARHEQRRRVVGNGYLKLAAIEIESIGP